jgi:hypothetical protein
MKPKENQTFKDEIMRKTALKEQMKQVMEIIDRQDGRYGFIDKNKLKQKIKELE